MLYTRSRRMFVGSILIGFVLLITGLVILPKPTTVPNQSASEMYNAYTLQIIHSKEFIVIMVGGGMVFVGGLIWAITECNSSGEEREIMPMAIRAAPVVPVVPAAPLVDLEAGNGKMDANTQTIYREKSVSFFEPVQAQAPVQAPVQAQVQYARPAVHALPSFKPMRILDRFPT